MATIQTIATTLTADPRGLQVGFSAAEKSAEKLGLKLDVLDKQFQTKMSNMGRTAGGRRGDAAGGFLELSRGLEDAAVGFELNGIQGAVRGASNNLTQLALIMGGPVAGAIAGLTAAALPTLIKQFWDTESSAEAAKKALESFGDQLAKQQEEAKRGAAFAEALGGAKSVEDLDAQIKEREALIKSAMEQEKVLQQQREAEDAARNRGIMQNREGFGGAQTRHGQLTGQDLFGNDRSRLELSFEKSKKIHDEQLKLIEDRAKAEEELNQLFEERNKLRDAERNADEIAALEARAKKNREQEEQEQKNRDREIQEAERELENLRTTGGSPARLAQAVTADSQAMLRAQYQAKEAAEAKKQREQQRKVLEDILRQLRNPQVAAIEPGEDVNLV